MKISYTGNIIVRTWLALCLFTSPFLAAMAQTQALGEKIYQHGQTEANLAWLSSSNKAEDLTSIPSTMVPCVNCHGERGGGSREGGVLAPPVRWYSLSMPKSDRQHDKQHAFTLAVNKGVGLNGQLLNANMPRYQLSADEVSAMVAYLKMIDSKHPVGVSAGQIKLELVLPKNAGLAKAMRETIQDYLDQLNDNGGIYSRSLVIDTDVDVNVESNTRHTQTTDSEPRATFVTLDLRTTAPDPQQTDQTQSSPFAIRLFANEAIEQAVHDHTDAYALYPHPQHYQALRIEAAQQRGWKYRLVDQANLAEILTEQQALDPFEQAQWALIPAADQLELLTLFRTLSSRDIQTNILVDMRAVSTLAREAAASYRGPIFTLLPPGLESVTEDGQRILSKLSGTPQRYRNWLQQRLWALSAVRLLEASLQQSGRDLTLRGFSKAMQGQVDLITDFGPRLSYSANRRIGSLEVTLKSLN